MPRPSAREPIDDCPTVVYTRTPTPPWTATPRRPATLGRVPPGPPARRRSGETVRVVRVEPSAVVVPTWTIDRAVLGFTAVLAVVVVVEWLIF